MPGSQVIWASANANISAPGGCWDFLTTVTNATSQNMDVLLCALADNEVTVYLDDQFLCTGTICSAPPGVRTTLTPGLHTLRALAFNTDAVAGAACLHLSMRNATTGAVLAKTDGTWLMTPYTLPATSTATAVPTPNAPVVVLANWNAGLLTDSVYLTALGRDTNAKWIWSATGGVTAASKVRVHCYKQFTCATQVAVTLYALAQDEAVFLLDENFVGTTHATSGWYIGIQVTVSAGTHTMHVVVDNLQSGTPAGLIAFMLRTSDSLSLWRTDSSWVQGVTRGRAAPCLCLCVGTTHQRVAAGGRGHRAHHRTLQPRTLVRRRGQCDAVCGH